MRCRAIQFIGLWAVVLSTTPVTYGVEFAGGTGTLEDPHQIATAEQLLAIRQDGMLADKHFVLAADIDLDPNQPSQVLSGTLLNLSSGSFDGRGHRIVNLQIAPYDRGAPPLGTLGPQAIVRNLHLEGVVASGDFSQWPYDFGVLARQNAGLIANCSLKGPSCGIGIVGSNTGYILGCSVTVDDGGAARLAGTNSGIILFSHVTGGSAVDGGLVHENSGMISGCYSTAAVSGHLTAGGLVGTNSGTISRCYATGAVSVEAASQSSTCLTGGLVGANSGEISDCYALGASRAWVGRYSGSACAGGLAGNSTGTISHCYATGAGGQGLIGDAAFAGLTVSCYHLHPADGGGNIYYYGLGIPLTDAQMRRRENFIGWDFRGSDLDGVSEIWYMPEGGGYPMLTDLQGPPLGGSGTAEDPYLIESGAQLWTIYYDLGAHYRLTSDIDLRGQTFTGPVIPIFLGHLDGDGHTLFNFTLAGEEDIGFFGTIYPDAEVVELNMYNVHVMTAQGSGMKLAGVLAARNHGTIVCCTGSADTSILKSGVEFIGGLIGINEDDGQVSRSFVSWSATAWFDRGGDAGLGAVAGRNIGRIAECHASVLASVNFAHCAALVGRNDGTVADCYADGYSNLAGLVHSNYGSIANCYAAVNVPSGKGKAAGGLVSANVLGATIENSYSLVLADGGGPDNGLGTFLSDAQMKAQSSFDGWDFDGTWSIREGEGYPCLRWELDAQRR